jgi:hypothetical protein
MKLIHKVFIITSVLIISLSFNPAVPTVIAGQVDGATICTITADNLIP